MTKYTLVGILQPSLNGYQETRAQIDSYMAVQQVSIPKQARHSVRRAERVLTSVQHSYARVKDTDETSAGRARAGGSVRLVA